MAGFLLCIVNFLLFSTLSVNGQCSASTCKGSAWDEDLMESLEEHDLKLRILGEKLFSTFGDLDERLSTRLQEMNESISSRLQAMNEGISSRLQAMNESISSRLQAMNESMVRASRDNELKLQAIHENVSATIEKVYDKLNAVFDLANETIQHVKSKDYCPENLTVCDCSTIRLNGFTMSGMYRIYVVDQQRRYYAKAFCDMTTTSGSWTVFQRRRDGSEDFYRGWSDYANGFGNSNGEFWIGNDFLYLLTSKKRYKLRIDLEDFAGNKRFAEYSTFNISSSTDKYKLTVGGYSGDAGNSLSYHSGRQFSTKDQDNDVYKANCSNRDQGAWWYGWCHRSNLNGIYYNGGSYTLRTGAYSGDGIVWYYWLRSSYSLKTTEMKISSY